jgi:hypothetical protein
LLLFAPVFIDYASLHYARRAAQKAADAAALAAAVEYANLLSIDTGWDLRVTPATYFACCCVKKKGPCEVGVYMGIMFIGGELWMWITGSAEAKAEEYAKLNGSTMTVYTPPSLFYLLPWDYYYFFPTKIKIVESVPVPPLAVRVEVERDVPMIYEALYGRGKFKVTARATAEAYLYKVEKGTGPLPEPVLDAFLKALLPSPIPIRFPLDILWLFKEWGIPLPKEVKKALDTIERQLELVKEGVKATGITEMGYWFCYIPPKKVGKFKTFKFKWKVRLVE